jgi:outer membrane protein assembly factor BamB
VLVALDALTGKTIWSHTTVSSELSETTPVLADGKVFVRTMGAGAGSGKFGSSYTFSVEAFRAVDGERLWHASVGFAGGWNPSPAMAADGQLVIYPSEDGSLYALDADTGALRWKAPNIGNRAGAGLAPSIVNGLVWAGDSNDRLAAFDLGNGRKLWTSTRFGEVPGFGTATCSPVVADRFVLCGTADGRLIAYRVTS